MNYKGETVQFSCGADNGATLAGVRFGYGDMIEITLGRDWDESEGRGEGGPWGWGGYTHHLIYSIADEIVDLGTGERIWSA